MDIENLKSWASQPDACRCCLSTSGSWDLQAGYLNDAGEKLIYSEILTSCFGISLSFLSEWGTSRLVCDQCVGRLLDAHSFRTQVFLAEEQFRTYINDKQGEIQETVKTEHIHRTNELQNELAEANSNDGNVDINPDDGKWLIGTNTEEQAIGKSTRHSEDGIPEDSIYDNAKEAGQTTRGVKIVSERKRIKITCSIILQETTACPFRHHRSWFQCFFCTQAFIDMSSLRLHTAQTHTASEEVKHLKRYPRSLQIDISELVCRRCDTTLEDVEAMRIHLLTHSLVIYKECIADYKVNCSPYSCHLCGKQFHVFRTLTTHLNEHYANYICAVCGKSYINSKRLKVHSRTHEKGVFPCSQCSKVLKTKSSQANHIESHSKRVIKCQICSKPMKHYNDRIKHMSEVHNITHKFKCPMCPKEYTIKHYLATHIRQTHGHKNKNCLECGMAFITNYGLKKHMRKHSDKVYSCEYCSQSYARSYSLKDHMRQHALT